MSDQPEQPSPAIPATPGEWLRQERERQGRALQQIASELHLSVAMIEAIENNQFATLGAPVFARGHLRKYASLLGLPIDRVQDLYQNLGDRPRDPDHVPVIHRDSEPSIPMSPDSKERRANHLPKRMTLAIAGGALLVLVVIAWWVLGSKSTGTKNVQSSIALETNESSTANVTSEAATPTTDSSNAPSFSTPTTPQTSPASGAPTKSVGQPAASGSSAAPATAKSPLARGKVRLRFSFTQESWVEVYDAQGNRKLYDVGLPGQTRGVDVDAPAQVVLGLAAGVTTEVNGREIAVPSRRIASQVARFTVAGDGSVQ